VTATTPSASSNIVSMLSDAAARAGVPPALIKRARGTDCESFRAPSRQ
jgi:hypothetical protein